MMQPKRANVAVTKKIPKFSITLLFLVVLIQQKTVHNSEQTSSIQISINQTNPNLKEKFKNYISTPVIIFFGQVPP